MIRPHGTPDALRAQANLVQLSYLPGSAAKRSLLVAEAAAAAAIETLPKWCVDELSTNNLFTIENGVWVPGLQLIRMPPGKSSKITILPPVTAQKVVFVYIDNKCTDDMSLKIGIGGSAPAAVGFNRVDAFGHHNYWVSDLVSKDTAGDLVIEVTYDKGSAGDFDYFLGYGLAWLP